MKIAEYETEDGKVGVHYREGSVAQALFVCQDDIITHKYELRSPLGPCELCSIKEDLADEVMERAPTAELGACLGRVLENMRIPVKEDSDINIVDSRGPDRVSDRVADLIAIQTRTAKPISPKDTRDYLRSVGGRRQ